MALLVLVTLRLAPPTCSRRGKVLAIDSGRRRARFWRRGSSWGQFAAISVPDSRFACLIPNPTDPQPQRKPCAGQARASASECHALGVPQPMASQPALRCVSCGLSAVGPSSATRTGGIKPRQSKILLGFPWERSRTNSHVARSCWFKPDSEWYFFREVHPASEMGCKHRQNRAKRC